MTFADGCVAQAAGVCAVAVPVDAAHPMARADQVPRRTIKLCAFRLARVERRDELLRVRFAERLGARPVVRAARCEDAHARSVSPEELEPAVFEANVLDVGDRVFDLLVDRAG